MSSDATPTAATAAKPEAPAAAPAAAAKPEVPAFNTDVLESCTARFTRKAYNLYLSWRKDQAKIEQQNVRFALSAKTVDAAEEIHKLLVEAGVTEISRLDKTVSFTTTFRTLEGVVKHPQTVNVDAVAI